eukprot:s922_g28.t1
MQHENKQSLAAQMILIGWAHKCQDQDPNLRPGHMAGEIDVNRLVSLMEGRPDLVQTLQGAFMEVNPGADAGQVQWDVVMEEDLLDRPLGEAKVQMPSPELDDGAVQEISQLVFQDDRWQTAQQQLQMRALSREQALKMLQEGAKMYGFWPDLARETLESLVTQLMGSDVPSLGLQQWMAASEVHQLGSVVPKEQKAKSGSQASIKTGRTGSEDGPDGPDGPEMQTMRTFATSRFSADLVALDVADSSPSGGVEVQRFLQEEKLPKGNTMAMKPRETTLPDWKGRRWGAENDVYPQASLMFSWPIFFARLGGMATAVWTALLFLSMSRSILTICSRCLPRRGRSFWFTFLDCHKDLHIEAGCLAPLSSAFGASFGGKALVFYSAVHIVGHCIGTVPGVLQKDVAELNQLLGCAQEDPPYLVHWDLSIFHWPPCPLKEADKPMTFTEALFLTMPGLTGFFLVLVLAAVAWTSRHKFRAQSFECFWNLHNLAIILWPLLLFLHGSQGWIGIGIPLVIVVCGLPILLYAATRVARLFRYYCAGRSVKVLRAVVRLGKDDGLEGSLVQLEVTKPMCLWSWKRNAGMYAYICLPEYSKLQWHPFTITSSYDDETVNFLIAGIGDWTQELTSRCLNGTRLPRLALDGPFSAPTQSALDKRVLIAVGAGVGVTPFISLLSTLVSELVSAETKHGLVEAHFYWISREPTDFIFAWNILQKWLKHPILQSKIFIHLYCTAKGPTQNLKGFLFREAVRRQCLVDRKHFKSHLNDWLKQNEVQSLGPQFPWAWAEGGSEDLIWVKCQSLESQGVAAAFKTIHSEQSSRYAINNLGVEWPQLSGGHNTGAAFAVCLCPDPTAQKAWYTMVY